MVDVVNIHSDHQLFDPDAFAQSLATAQPLDAYKKALKHLNDTQYTAFKQQFSDDDFIRHAVYGRAWTIDQLLTEAWKTQAWPTDNIALLAVGGYGRGELLPHSDIDLLLLFESERDIEQCQPLIQAFITFLWDINLKIGHSVRTPDTCAAEAKKDLTVITTLIEHRLITGSEQIQADMAYRIRPEKMWPSSEFFTGKLAEQQNRHDRFNETEYNLEPNVKSSPGGLRDVQTIGWVAKRHFGDSRNRDLVTRGFLTAPEYQALRSGLAFLWRIRFGLHMLTERPEDRLLFDLQSQLAVLFGYEDKAGKIAIEWLMQDYYRRVIRLRSLNDMLLQHFDEVILQAGQRDNIIALNDRFQIRNGNIETLHPRVFPDNPSALLEVFVLMAKSPDIRGIRAATIRQIRQNRQLVDDAFRNTAANQALFMELLRSGKGVSTNLLRMNRFGILGLYLPEFGRIIGQMQHDLFHIYTVDAHTLLVIRNLRKFRHPGNTSKYPLVTDIIRSLPKIENAYIAALYHDIAKGRGGDHSSLGAADVRAFCERHGLPERDTTLIVWLVESHLLMSVTAQKKDLSDPKIIADFADKVQNQSYLDYLMVLTVADINATNPSIWNSWKASLLKQLYIETRRYLQLDRANPLETQQRIAAIKVDAMAILDRMGVDAAEVQRFWATLGDEYFVRESAESIAWHGHEILEAGLDSTSVLIREINEESYDGASQIFVYAPDRAHLFADIARALESLHLNIHDARILTAAHTQFSLDTFIVLDDQGNSLGSDAMKIETIRIKLMSAILQPKSVKAIHRRVPRQLKHFKFPAQVQLTNDPLQHRTQIDIVTVDRPGLLASIGEMFREFNIQIQNARISTFGERVEDVFFVLNADNQPFDLADYAPLQQALETKLNALQQE
jgi:[protein-PII] uridylyltransferase